jgi:biopolymer transport protein ExbD
MFESNLSNTPLAAITHSFQFAQRLPLQKRFSGPPAFALIGAPVLAVLVAILTLFPSDHIPTGLPVRLLAIGSLDSDPLSAKPVVITVVSASANGSAVIRVNGREMPLGNLNRGVDRKPKVPTQWTAYVEAGNTLLWGDVVNVIDVVQGLNANVVLLTTTPDMNYTHTQRSAKPTK